MNEDQRGSLPIDPGKRVDELARAYWQVLLWEAYSLIENWEDAQDIVQDMFLRVMKALEYEPGLQVGAPKAWLRSFLRYAFLDFLRKKKKANKYNFSEISLERLKNINPSEWEDLLDKLIDSTNKLSDIVAESNEGVADIVREIEKLRNKNMRNTLHLNLFEENTSQEIADKQQRPLGTVKSELSEGKKLLRTALRRKLDEEVNHDAEF